jgi:hypothetical protein
VSVLMMLRVNGDPTKVEALAAKDPGRLQKIVDRGKEYGVISHQFYGNESGVLVIDEWPDPESFQRFFAASPEIAGIMQEAGVTTEPEITFWRKLDTKDSIG